MSNKKYNIAVLGDSAVGKTVFITRFDHKYNLVSGKGIYSIPFETNHGKIILSVHDPEFVALSDWSNMDAFIMMFDHSNIASFLKTVEQVGFLINSNRNVPIIIVGNKYDLPARIPHELMTAFLSGKRLSYFDISAKTYQNIGKPFREILRYFISNDTQILSPIPTLELAKSREILKIREEMKQLILKLEAIMNE